MEELCPADYCVVLTTKAPVKQVALSLDEFMALLGGAANDGEVTRIATADEPNAAPPIIDIPHLIGVIDERLARYVQPRALGVPAADMEAAHQRIAALEQRVADLSQDRVSPSSMGETGLMDSDDVAGFASRFAPAIAGQSPAQRQAITAVDPAAVADLVSRVRDLEQIGMRVSQPSHDPRTQHDIANLRAEVDALTDHLRRMTTPQPQPEPAGYVDPRIAAMARVRTAGEAKRRSCAISGNPGMTGVLYEVAKLANTSQEAPMALMRAIGEAQQTTWSEAAKATVRTWDSLARACARTYAVEIATEAAMSRAADDAVDRVADGAIAVIERIEGQ